MRIILKAILAYVLAAIATPLVSFNLTLTAWANIWTYLVLAASFIGVTLVLWLVALIVVFIIGMISLGRQS